MVLAPLVVVLTGLAAALLLRRRQPARALDAVALAGGIVLALYAGEGLLALADVGPVRRAAWLSGRGFDARTRAEVVRDLRRDGVDAVPRVVPFAFVAPDGLRFGDGGPLFPLAGVPDATTVLCNEAGSWVVYPADEHGFRNPRGLHVPGAVDVALLGDSFVHGECVADGEDLAGRLRADGRRVLSLGISGDGPLLELATLVEHAEPLRPPVVVWAFYAGNDLTDLAHERRSVTLRRYVEDPAFRQGLAGRAHEIGARLRLYVDAHLALAETLRDDSADSPFAGVLALRRLETLATGPLRGRTGRASLPEPLDEGVDPLFARVIASARERVAVWGGRLLAVYLGRGRAEEPVPSTRPAVLDVFAEMGVPLLDFEAVVLAHPDPDELFPPGLRVHFDADGYRLLSSELARFIDSVP